jgi:hypothetical protein
MEPESVALATGVVAAIASVFLALEWRRRKRGEGFQWLMVYALAILAGGFFTMFGALSWFLLKGDYSSLIMGVVFGAALAIVGASRIYTEHWTWP